MIDNVKRIYDANGFLAADSLQISDAKKTKVVFLGDSITFGYNVPTESTFVEILDKLLPDINAINLAFPGYTSFQGYQMLLKRGIRINPDILVVSFNFNDRRYVIESDQTDNAITFQREYKKKTKIRKMRFLRYIYLYSSLHFLFKKIGIIKSKNPLNQKVRIANLSSRVSPEDYRKNLISIVEIAQKKNIYVIFMMLKDNPIETSYLRKGIEAYDNLDYEAAMEYLTIAVKKSAWFSDLARLYLAKLYKKQGLFSKGFENIYIMRIPFISLHGGFPIYLDTEYKKIMEEIAREYDVDLIDASRVLDENPPYYLDYCHPDMEGHRKIAYLLQDKLSKIIFRTQ